MNKNNTGVAYNPSDVVFGIFAWLTTRKEKVTFSSSNDANIGAQLAQEFIDVNEWGDVSKEYPATFKIPKEEIINVEKANAGLDFGDAIRSMKIDGEKVARKGWNGKNMFIVYMPALKLPPYNNQSTKRKVNDRTAQFIGKDKPLNSQPYFAMYNAQEEWIPGWLASQSDMNANDWFIV